MSIFRAIARTITAPVEIGVRTVSDCLDFSDDSIDDSGTCVDILTCGISRPIRKGISATRKTAKGIVSEFED